MSSLRFVPQWVNVFMLASLWISRVQPQSLSDITGDAIVSVMQTFSDKCPQNAPNGDMWAPLPADTACGSVKRCNFPDQWCAFKLGADGNPDLGTLNCQALSADCKKMFQDTAGGGGGGTTPAGGEGATSPAASEGTSGATEGTSPAAGGESSMAPSTPAEGETTPSMGGETTPSGGGESTPGAGGETPPAPTEEGMSSPPPEASPETPPAPTEGGASPGPETTPAAGTEGTTPAAGGGGGECCDYHEFCCYWASTGQCDTNKPFMAQICKKSCGACSCSGDPGQCTITVDATCSGGNVMPNPACPCKAGDLVHKDWNPKCSAWAARGDCDKNADYMKPMCKASCNVCQ